MKAITIVVLTLMPLLLAGCTASPESVGRSTGPSPQKEVGVTISPEGGGGEYQITGLNLGDCFEITGEGDFGVTAADCAADTAEYQVFYVKALSFDEEEAAAAGEPQPDAETERAAAEERLNAEADTASTDRPVFDLYEPNADGGVTQISAIALK